MCYKDTITQRNDLMLTMLRKGFILGPKLVCIDQNRLERIISFWIFRIGPFIIEKRSFFCIAISTCSNKRPEQI